MDKAVGMDLNVQQLWVLSVTWNHSTLLALMPKHEAVLNKSISEKLRLYLDKWKIKEILNLAM